MPTVGAKHKAAREKAVKKTAITRVYSERQAGRHFKRKDIDKVVKKDLSRKHVPNYSQKALVERTLLSMSQKLPEKVL